MSYQATFNTLYKRVQDGKLNEKQFLQEIRNTPHLAKEVNTNLKYDQVIKFLENRRLLITENKSQPKKIFDSNKFINEVNTDRIITRDQAHPYQYQTGIKEELEANGNDFEKAEATVLKKLSKDPFYYTNKNVTTADVDEPNRLLKEFLESKELKQKLSELSPDTYDKAAKAAGDRGQSTRAKNFAQKAGTDRANSGNRQIRIDNTEYTIQSIDKVGKSVVLRLNSGLVDINPDNIRLVVNDSNVPKRLAIGKIHDTPEGKQHDLVKIDRKTANILLKATKLVGMNNYNIDSFNVDGIHSEIKLQELNPKTYLSSKNKAQAGGDQERAAKFQGAYVDSVSKTPREFERFVGQTLFGKKIMAIFQNEAKTSLTILIETSESTKTSVYYTVKTDSYTLENGTPISKVKMDESDKYNLSQIAKIFNKASKLSPDTVKTASQAQ